MNTDRNHLLVSGVQVEVVYKDIKNMHLSVYPPSGRVRVAAPMRLTEAAIRLAVVQRLTWIKKNQARLVATTRQSQREMVSGESHYLWGRRVRLDVLRVPGRPAIGIVGKRLVIRAPESMTDSALRKLLLEWHRQELSKEVTKLLDKWQPITGLDVGSWSVRRMKTKWGTCDPVKKRIGFNLELVKKDPKCLEYIIVHELVHLRERSHNMRFVSMMDGLLPQWRASRAILNNGPISQEPWGHSSTAVLKSKT